ncbi:hypothetical protein C0992_009270 [Termitomyces sp. T32_za158]|nr:hypothetical protein C0992_009270 [Termitomyces sp. T32_za158]
MPFLILRGLLGQDCASCKVGAVGLDIERMVIIVEDKDGLGGDGRLEGIKGPLLRVSPGLSYVPSGKVKQQLCMVGEILDELLIEVGEPQEGLYLLLVLGLWPLDYAGHLRWVHLCHTLRDDQSKVLNAGLLELALLQFEVELVQAEMVQDNSSDATMLL